MPGAGEYVVAEKGAADAEALRSPRSSLALPTHDSSSSLDWDPASEAALQARARVQGCVPFDIAAAEGWASPVSRSWLCISKQCGAERALIMERGL